MIRFSTVTAAALVVATAAGQTTTSASSSTHIPLFGAGTTTLPVASIAGSIVGVDSSETTIVVNCLTGTSCGIGAPSLTLTQGPSTWIGDIVTQTVIESQTAIVTFDIECDIVSSTQGATCAAIGTATVDLGGLSIATTFTTTETILASQIRYDQLLITAGVDKLNNVQATQSSTGAAGAVVAPIPTGNLGMGIGGMAAAAVVAVAGIL